LEGRKTAHRFIARNSQLINSPILSTIFPGFSWKDAARPKNDFKGKVCLIQEKIMKTSTSHIHRLLPAILVILFLTFAAAAQNINNQITPQADANFNIDGTGKAKVFDTTEFDIGSKRILSIEGANNFFAGASTGLANTSGYGNSFVGSGAGQFNSTGSYNSFAGFGAGSKTRRHPIIRMSALPRAL